MHLTCPNRAIYSPNYAQHTHPHLHWPLKIALCYYPLLDMALTPAYIAHRGAWGGYTLGIQATHFTIIFNTLAQTGLWSGISCTYAIRLLLMIRLSFNLLASVDCYVIISHPSAPLAQGLTTREFSH
ncbi:hypothetical protein AMTRI_Chr02g216970 [Amborella trichopoda]